MQFFMIGCLITDKSRSWQHSNHLIFCTPNAFPFFWCKKTCKRIAFSGFFLQKMHLPANILRKEWKGAKTAIQDGYLTHSLLTFVVSSTIKWKLQWQKMFIFVSVRIIKFPWISPILPLKLEKKAINSFRNWCLANVGPNGNKRFAKQTQHPTIAATAV